MELQCIGFDITNWKKAEKGLLQTLRERNTILESIGDAFFAIDKNWVVTYWNNEAEAISKIQRADIVGKHFMEYSRWRWVLYLQNNFKNRWTKTVPNILKYYSSKFTTLVGNYIVPFGKRFSGIF